MARTFRSIVVGALVGAGLAGVISAGLTGATRVDAPRPADTAAMRDMNGAPVALDPGAVAPPPASSDAVADTGSRLVVPSVGLDVPLGALDAVDGQITPPGFTSAYRVRNVGVPLADADHGTVYVVMHSLRGGGIGPGNYLTDVDTGRATVAQGATVSVAGVDYTVTGWQTVSKTALANDPGVWADAPGRLVLVTCLELPSGAPSVDNMVIVASRAGSTPAASPRTPTGTDATAPRS